MPYIIQGNGGYSMLRLMLGISLFVEGLSFYFYNSILFSPKRSAINRILTYILTYLIIIIFHRFDSTYSIIVNMLLFFAGNAVILLYLYKLPPLSAIMHCLLISGYSVIAEVVIGNIYTLFIAKYWENWQNENNLIYLSSSVLLFAVLTVSTALVEKRINKHTLSFNGIVPVLFLAILALVMIVVNYFYEFLIQPESDNIIAMLNIIILSILLLGFVFMYIYMYRAGIMLSRQKQQHQAEKDYIDYYKELNRRDTEQRIIMHDMKNHLLAMQNIIEGDDYKKLRDYIQNMVHSSFFKQPMQYCRNDYINSIIFRYQKAAEEKHISFSVDSGNFKLSFIDNYDLTIIFCNLLDNAMEAAVESTSPYISITLSCDSGRHINVIKITNSCNKQVKFIDGIPISSKKNAFAHGLGLKSVHNSISKYDGTISMHQNGNYDFCTIVVFREENMDDEHSDMR